MNDVLPQILSYIPVRSLIRFERVSKQWKQIIYKLIRIGNDFSYSLICPHNSDNRCFTCQINNIEMCHASTASFSYYCIVKCIDALDNYSEYSDIAQKTFVPFSIIKNILIIQFSDNPINLHGVSIYNQMRVLLSLQKCLR
jgi:hypothetical protein